MKSPDLDFLIDIIIYDGQSRLFHDFRHPNDLGYKILAKNIMEVVFMKTYFTFLLPKNLLKFLIVLLFSAIDSRSRSLIKSKASRTSSLAYPINEKAYLGISAGFHDSSACLVGVNGSILFASSEERFTRIKGDRSFRRILLQRL